MSDDELTVQRLLDLLKPPKGDKPRKIVVCSKADYPAIQKAVTDLGYGDVLVKPSRFVEDGQTYVMDPADAIIAGSSL